MSGFGGATTVALEDEPDVLGRCSWVHSATLKSFGFAHVEAVASRSAGGNVARTRFGVGVCDGIGGTATAGRPGNLGGIETAVAPDG